MARYIDADALREKMFHEAFEKDSQDQKWDSGCWIRYHMFEDAIDSIPTADVVEVVRCKDCKHRKGAFHADRRRKEGGYWVYWCELDTGEPFELGRNAEDDNWFCADGERREDG